jgi:polysaccharide biosynthesis protein PslH
VWRYDSPEFDACLSRHLAVAPPDVVHVEGYFLTGHLPADLSVPLVLVEENVEYLIDRQNEVNGRDRGASWREARAREYASWSKASIIGGVCQEDVDIIRRDAPHLNVSVFPNGADHLAPALPGTPSHSAPASQVTFIGNYSWPPTLDGAWSLVKDIWPQVSDTCPMARLALVGAGMPGELRSAAEAAKNIDVIGQIESVLPALAATDVFVCPLWVDSGIKVKMIEALSAGCAVVCTRSALRGLPAETSRAVMVAGNPRGFAEAITALLRDPARRRELSHAATQVLQAFPTWDQAAEILLAGWQRAARVGPRCHGELPSSLSEVDRDFRGLAGYDGGVTLGAAVAAGAASDRELESARPLRRGSDQPGQVDLAAGEHLGGRDLLVGRATAQPGDGVTFPVMADLPGATHELVGDKFDVADGKAMTRAEVEALVADVVFGEGDDRAG